METIYEKRKASMSPIRFMDAFSLMNKKATTVKFDDSKLSTHVFDKLQIKLNVQLIKQMLLKNM